MHNRQIMLLLQELMSSNYVMNKAYRRPNSGKICMYVHRYIHVTVHATTVHVDITSHK